MELSSIPHIDHFKRRELGHGNRLYVERKDYEKKCAIFCSGTHYFGNTKNLDPSSSSNVLKERLNSPFGEKYGVHVNAKIHNSSREGMNQLKHGEKIAGK
ncbi:hypothetical protein WA026_001931 [Henosepilachna vigintioctopunctata]|uniref:Uncharacterized protein n=1 Tax=Henosepilachna vigintioctopunctata TaxID=420089 RepID=A0AAW1UT85_9CUCU